MNKGSQIKTHFDIKIILFFAIIFILSCALLAFKINDEKPCTITNFKIDAPSFKAGELITFSDVSKGAYEWRWYFGDGTTISYRSKVGHSFSKPGKYTVKLMVNNSCKVEKDVTIVEQKEVLNNALLPKFYAPKVVYEGEPVKFKDSTSHAKSWEWRFGDGLNEGFKIDAIDKNPTYVFRRPGEKVVSLVVNGDVKHVQYAKLIVLPSKKTKKDMVVERLKRREQTRVDPVQEYFSNIPDAPKRSPEIANIDDAKLKALLLGISEDKLSHDNLVRYFCKDALPLVELKGGKMISLESLDKDIRNRSIRIKKIALVKDKDNCVTLIKLNFNHRSIF